MKGQVQTVRVTEEVFLPDSELRTLLRLGPSDIILRVDRKSGMFHLKGQARGQAIDLQGTIITIYRGGGPGPERDWEDLNLDGREP